MCRPHVSNLKPEIDTAPNANQLVAKSTMLLWSALDEGPAESLIGDQLTGHSLLRLGREDPNAMPI
jgi:hypothetical protein